MVSEDEFLFLNEKGSLSELSWNGGQKSKLWRYNQHYFDDLNAINSAQRAEWHTRLLHKWVLENTPAHGIAWEAYPTSLRIVNWIKWQLSGNSLPEVCLQSLVVQAHWLSKSLEHHILGNHLLANAKALVYAGIFFAGKEAQSWLDLGLKLISRELPEQVLSDGGHFERSPMYQSIVLEDFLDLVNISQSYPDVIESQLLTEWKTCIEKMLCWLLAMCHPDNEISYFNDAGLGIAPKPQELYNYAKRLGCVRKVNINNSVRRVSKFSDSGYVRLQSNHAVALLDVAPLGPDYLLGHGHADTLSFELSLFAQRVIVNCGTSCYGIGLERLRERSTAAHNTVEIDGENSSEVWSNFRVARRAYPFDFTLQESAEGTVVNCSHDGYCRLPGKPVHGRKWHMSKSELMISDYIEGSYEKAIARFHLHPDIKLLPSGHSNTWLLRLANSELVAFRVTKGLVNIESSNYALEFGLIKSSQCLAVCLEQNQSEVMISWSESFYD